jgi:hypothetical protein
MNLPEEQDHMTRDEETEKTKRLYPQLTPFIPTAPPNIYPEPTPPHPC